MKLGGGKRKGSSFERKIAKELSLWITNGQRNDIFWRTHSSGSLGTVGKRKAEYGDIMSIDDLGKPLTDKYNIECRHGKCLDIRQLIRPTKNSSVIQLIEEGRINSKQTGRRPLWILKEQGRTVLVMMELCDAVKIQHLVKASFPRFDVAVIDFEDWKKEFKLIGVQNGH